MSVLNSDKFCCARVRYLPQDAVEPGLLSRSEPVLLGLYGEL